jgi:uncharacterized membrane protein
MFLLFSHAGWIWEVLLVSSVHGCFINRGFMRGPWLPVYGIGSVLLICLLGRFWKNPFLVFGSSALLCGALEYATALCMELVFHKKWWDYSDAPFNFQGRTCLLVMVLFGILGYVLVCYIAPFCSRMIGYIPNCLQTYICRILLAVFLLDYLYSLRFPNIGAGITCS